MIIRERKLKGTFEIELEPREDHRGFFVRTYDEEIFEKFGIARKWVQENESFSKKKGVIRGLHFQYPPHSEGKLMRISSGKAFLVWVDLRRGSPTLGEWDSVEISSQNKKMVYTPRGFGNGLCTLSDDCTLLYKMDNYYHSESQDAILWNDPDLNIKWPVSEPSELSERDLKGKSFKEFLKLSGGLETD